MASAIVPPQSISRSASSVLLVLSCYFGILHSTGVLTIAFDSAVKQAEFAGAFAGFLATFIFLIRSYNSTAQARIFLSGNVLWQDGSPASQALVFVEGTDRQKFTDTTGWFQIEVPNQDRWTVRVTIGEVTANAA